MYLKLCGVGNPISLTSKRADTISAESLLSRLSHSVLSAAALVSLSGMSRLSFARDGEEGGNEYLWIGAAALGNTASLSIIIGPRRWK